MPEQRPRAVVVGAGIGGVSCALELQRAGVAVTVRDRARHPGGRMAVRLAQLPSGPHTVDVGASYFTVRDEAFAAVADGWRRAGLAREWTDTFHLAGGDGLRGTTTGPQRWAASNGLRSLVARLAERLPVELDRPVSAVRPAGRAVSVDGERVDAAVLAMPDPQAARVLPEELSAELGLGGRRDWAPVLAVWTGWQKRWWPDLDGAFVEDSAVLTWVCDDGRRRGDGAPVLVAHTTPIVAAGNLDRPEDVLPAVLAELPVVLGTARPDPPHLLDVHRWSFAKPLHQHAEAFGLHPAMIGVCGDGWGPQARVEQAFGSGRALGRELARRLLVTERHNTGYVE